VSKLIGIEIRSHKRSQLIDVTSKVKDAIDKCGISDGKVEIFVPHTTAAITINENCDPTVQSDILSYLEKMVPRDADYRHAEGNSDAHIKSSLVGTSVSIFISDGDLHLGTWQGIYFCEFDGPRNRQAILKITAD